MTRDFYSFLLQANNPRKDSIITCLVVSVETIDKRNKIDFTNAPLDEHYVSFDSVIFPISPTSEVDKIKIDL